MTGAIQQAIDAVNGVGGGLGWLAGAVVAHGLLICAAAYVLACGLTWRDR